MVLRFLGVGRKTMTYSTVLLHIRFYFSFLFLFNLVEDGNFTSFGAKHSCTGHIYTF